MTTRVMAMPLWLFSFAAALLVSGFFVVTNDRQVLAHYAGVDQAEDDSASALERGPCPRASLVPRLRHEARLRKPPIDHTIEWYAGDVIDAATERGPGPSFDCLQIHAEWEVHESGVTEWCAPRGTARINWSIVNGTLPFQVSVPDLVEVTAHTDVAYVDVSCESIRSAYADISRRDQQTVALHVHVEDAFGLATSGTVMISLVSAAPTERIQSLEVDPGPYDAVVNPHPRALMQSLESDPSELPIPVVAVLRFRAAGEPEWRYATALPPPWRGRVPHLLSLVPNTEYELQAAWMWNSAVSAWSQWFTHWLDWWEDESDRDTWWTSWSTADALHWSETYRFRTLRKIILSSDATSDALRVTWPTTPGKIRVLAYSPDYPNVVWADQHNSYRWVGDDPTTTSLISGLPADTPFHVEVHRWWPSDFPEWVQLRTLPTSSETSTDWADPSTFDVTLKEDTLSVEWKQQWPFAYTRTVLHSVPWDISLEPDRWILPPELHELRLFDQHFERRVQNVFEGLAPGSAWRLHINRTPGHVAGPDDSVPYLCMFYAIRVASESPDAHLNPYPLSSWRSEIEEVAINEVQAGYEHVEGCRLADPTSE